MSARLELFDGETPEDLARIAKRRVSERGRFSTAVAADELLSLVEGADEPRREAMLTHITLVGATAMIRKAAHERPDERICEAAAQLTLNGIGVNDDISVPMDKGAREYVQVARAKPAEMEAAAVPLRRHAAATMQRAETLELLAAAVRDLGGEDATIESLIRDGMLDEDARDRLFGS